MGSADLYIASLLALEEWIVRFFDSHERRICILIISSRVFLAGVYGSNIRSSAFSWLLQGFVSKKAMPICFHDPDESAATSCVVVGVLNEIAVLYVKASCLWKARLKGSNLCRALRLMQEEDGVRFVSSNPQKYGSSVLLQAVPYAMFVSEVLGLLGGSLFVKPFYHVQ